MYNCLRRFVPEIQFSCCWDVKQLPKKQQQTECVVLGMVVPGGYVVNY